MRNTAFEGTAIKTLSQLLKVVEDLRRNWVGSPQAQAQARTSANSGNDRGRQQVNNKGLCDSVIERCVCADALHAWAYEYIDNGDNVTPPLGVSGRDDPSHRFLYPFPSAGKLF